MAGEIINNGKSSVNNVSEINWVQQEVKRNLNFLAKELKNSSGSHGGNFYKNNFYEKNADGTVSYNMRLVEQYLNEFEKWPNEEGYDVYGDDHACVMAVQIALEYLGYDVGVIDGILKTKGKSTSNTMKAIKEFQRDNGIKLVDGLISHQVVSKILENLRKH